MNGHAKRAEKAIRDLGFEFNAEITDQHRNGKHYYTHPLAPAEAISIYASLTEQSSRIVIDRARQIAGLDKVGAKRRNAEIKQRRREQQAKNREREARDRQAYQKRADEAAVGIALERAIRDKERRNREIRQLMMPGRSK